MIESRQIECWNAFMLVLLCVCVCVYVSEEGTMLEGMEVKWTETFQLAHQQNHYTSNKNNGALVTY